MLIFSLILSLNAKVYMGRISLHNNFKDNLKMCSNIFTHAAKIWDDTTGKHGLAYRICRCSF